MTRSLFTFAVAALAALADKDADVKQISDSQYVRRIAKATSPSLIWSSLEDAYPNTEVDKAVQPTEVMESLSQGLTYADRPSRLIVYGLPGGTTTKKWVEEEAESGSSFKAQGSFLLYPYTLITPGSPSDEDWATLIAAVGSKGIKFLGNSDGVDASSVIEADLETERWSTIRSRMGDARVLVIEPGLFEEATGRKSVSKNLAKFFGEVKMSKDEAVFVIVVDAASIYRGALPAVLNRRGAVLNVFDDEAGGAAAKRQLSEAEILTLRQIDDTPSAFPRKLQYIANATDDMSGSLHTTATQVSMLIFMGTMFVAILIAVMCTMTISTPKFNLEKPIFVNKEF